MNFCMCSLAGGCNTNHFFRILFLIPVENIIGWQWNLQSKTLLGTASKWIIDDRQVIFCKAHLVSFLTTVKTSKLWRAVSSWLPWMSSESKEITCVTKPTSWSSLSSVGSTGALGSLGTGTLVFSGFVATTLGSRFGFSSLVRGVVSRSGCSPELSDSRPMDWAPGVDGDGTILSASGGLSIGLFTLSLRAGLRRGLSGLLGSSGARLVLDPFAVCHSRRDAGLTLSGAQRSSQSRWDIQITELPSWITTRPGPCHLPTSLLLGLRLLTQ